LKQLKLVTSRPLVMVEGFNFFEPIQSFVVTAEVDRYGFAPMQAAVVECPERLDRMGIENVWTYGEFLLVLQDVLIEPMMGKTDTYALIWDSVRSSHYADPDVWYFTYNSPFFGARN
jgi:hypothetical protein